ncbi:MAG: PspC domain-containing protein [Peptococcaceae bacterium]|nr:PspC domain-containing protein [Peptococcaceae bacterium]
MNKPLYRSNRNKVLAGVCSGIAEYFEMDPTIIRIIWVLSIFAGVGIIAYIVCWLIMPESYETFSSSGDESTTKDSSHFDKEKSKHFLGIALIVIGCLFMFDKFFRWFNIDVIMPLGIIAIGAYILWNAKGEKE